MQIKSLIIRFAADADMRVKIIKQLPHIFDGYVVTVRGEVLSPEEARHFEVFNYYLDGLNFISSKV